MARLRRGWARHVPTIGPDVLLVPPFIAMRDVAVVNLIDLGRIFSNKAIRLDKIRKYIVACRVPSNAPNDFVSAFLEPAGTAHEAVNILHFISHVVEGRTIASPKCNAVR